ncbi:MAG TPA: hypothetical protein VN519_05900 [Bryobacteraceae bacterium]|nr:hypothetical protein [Bryobacteraceae bacterium]
MFTPKLELVVGSSVRGLNYARAVQTNVNYDAWIRVWNQGIFRTGSYPVDDLINKPRDHQLRLPCDLAGVNLADFSDGPNAVAAPGPAADDILTKYQ